MNNLFKYFDIEGSLAVCLSIEAWTRIALASAVDLFIDFLLSILTILWKIKVWNRRFKC